MQTGKYASLLKHGPDYSDRDGNPYLGRRVMYQGSRRVIGKAATIAIITKL